MIRKWFILFFFLPLTLSCARDLVTGKKTYNIYSIGSDVKLGRYVMKAQLKSLGKDKKFFDSGKNRKNLDVIKEIVADIVKGSHYPDFPYEVHLADVDIVNAWCAPGGKIMVYEGLWDPKKGLVKEGDKDELAAVLAHEIAHATARHVTEALTLNFTILAAGQLATEVIGSASAEGRNIFQKIFSEGFDIFIPSYSRKNELEADRVGLIYMAKAGYDPRAAVRLWVRAAQEKKGDLSSLYSSHPSSGIRAKELQKHLPEAMVYYEEAKKSKKRSGMYKKH